MGTTTKGLRYPEATDRVTDGATAIKNLATDVDAKLPNTASPKVQAGYTPVTPVANTPTLVNVTFPTPFATVPAVTASADTASAAVTSCQAANITTTGFQIMLIRTNTTATSVSWIAAVRGFVV